MKVNDILSKSALRLPTSNVKQFRRISEMNREYINEFWETILTIHSFSVALQNWLSRMYATVSSAADKAAWRRSTLDPPSTGRFAEETMCVKHRFHFNKYSIFININTIQYYIHTLQIYNTYITHVQYKNYKYVIHTLQICDINITNMYYKHYKYVIHTLQICDINISYL